MPEKTALRQVFQRSRGEPGDRRCIGGKTCLRVKLSTKHSIGSRLGNRLRRVVKWLHSSTSDAPRVRLLWSHTTGPIPLPATVSESNLEPKAAPNPLRHAPLRTTGQRFTAPAPLSFPDTASPPLKLVSATLPRSRLHEGPGIAVHSKSAGDRHSSFFSSSYFSVVGISSSQRR